MKNLVITVTENGFIVSQDRDTMHATIERQWVFETPAGLATFIEKWGKDIKNPPEKTASSK